MTSAARRYTAPTSDIYQFLHLVLHCLHEVWLLEFWRISKKSLVLSHLLSIINRFIKVLSNNDSVCKIKVVEFIMITSSKSPLSKRPRVDKGKLPFLQGHTLRLYSQFYWLRSSSRINANFDVDVCIGAIIKGLSVVLWVLHGSKDKGGEWRGYFPESNNRTLF